MADKILKTVIQVRRDTTANWTANKTTVPAEGEPCLDLDTGIIKYGDGVTTYENLPEYGRQASHYEGTRQGTETDAEVIARVMSTTTVNVDDVFVVKSLISSGKYAYTAYIYDGTNWTAMDGNYDAENVYFGKDLTITANVGVQTIDQTGSKVISTSGKNVKQVLDMLFASEKNPTISQPTVTVTSSQVKAYEVGTNVTPSFSAVLNPGSYQYGPATGITANAWSVTDSNGGTVAAASGAFDAFVVADDTDYTITALATYGAGSVPVTNLGNDYDAGTIVAGSKSGAKGKITGYRNGFYGTLNVKTGTVDSALVRGLTGKTNATPNNGKVINLTVPVGAIRVVFAYPATLRDVSSVLDVNGMNAEIKSAFTKSVVNVEGANGYTAVSYKVYVMDMAAANDAANTFKVTI